MASLPSLLSKTVSLRDFARAICDQVHQQRGSLIQIALSGPAHLTTTVEDAIHTYAMSERSGIYTIQTIRSETLEQEAIHGAAIVLDIGSSLDGIAICLKKNRYGPVGCLTVNSKKKNYDYPEAEFTFPEFGHSIKEMVNINDDPFHPYEYIFNSHIDLPSLDGLTVDEGLDIILDMANKTLKDYQNMKPQPKYMHLRRYDVQSEEYIQTGGITLAYTREGNWYKVGAAFCSLKDVYQKHGADRNGKLVGRDLAEKRLRRNPIWIHAESWVWGPMEIVHQLSTKQGRVWYDIALRKGLYEEWDLRTMGWG